MTRRTTLIRRETIEELEDIKSSLDDWYYLVIGRYEDQLLALFYRGSEPMTDEEVSDAVVNSGYNYDLSRIERIHDDEMMRLFEY